MQQQDPSVQWSHHLARLDPSRRSAVVAALEHSASTGWPASERAVELLVSYAIGEITAAAYAAGILESLGLTDDDTVSRATATEPAVVPPVEREGERVSRHDAVQAYVTGRIDVSEFLRIARA